MPVLTSDGEAYLLDALLAKLTADGKTLYAELTTTTPTKASAGTAATCVSRTAITLSRPNGQDYVENAEVDFGNATGDQDLVGVNIWDAATNGTRYLYGALSGTVSAVNGQPVKILAGDFTFTPDANA